MASQVEKLADALGFNPVSQRPSQEVFEKALAEVKEERDEQLLDRAKNTFKSAMGLVEEFEKKRRAFQGEEKKFNKALGKLMNQINAGLKGREPPPEEKETDSDSEESPTE